MMARLRNRERGYRDTAALILIQRRTGHTLLEVEPDQRVVHPLLQRIERDQTKCHLNGSIDAAGEYIVVEKSLQGIAQHFVIVAAFGHHPLFERWPARCKAFEEFAAVQVDRALEAAQRPVGNELFELQRIDVDALRRRVLFAEASRTVLALAEPSADARASSPAAGTRFRRPTTVGPADLGSARCRG
jgi:hypothetical protein